MGVVGKGRGVCVDFAGKSETQQRAQDALQREERAEQKRNKEQKGIRNWESNRPAKGDDMSQAEDQQQQTDPHLIDCELREATAILEVDSDRKQPCQYRRSATPLDEGVSRVDGIEVKAAATCVVQKHAQSQRT